MWNFTYLNYSFENIIYFKLICKFSKLNSSGYFSYELKAKKGGLRGPLNPLFNIRIISAAIAGNT